MQYFLHLASAFASMMQKKMHLASDSASASRMQMQMHDAENIASKVVCIPKYIASKVL